MPKLTHAGVLPYRKKGSRIQILLITNRNRRHWIIPKGHVNGHGSVKRAARREALEEAGITGVLGSRPLGRYRTRRKGKPKDRAIVYPLRVAKQLRSWPEKDRRALKWVGVRKAQGLIRKDMTHLIKNFAMQMVSTRKSHDHLHMGTDIRLHKRNNLFRRALTTFFRWRTERRIIR